MFDKAPADSLEEALQRDYIARGTPGLKDFIPGRIISAADLAVRVLLQRDRYLEGGCRGRYAASQ